MNSSLPIKSKFLSTAAAQWFSIRDGSGVERSRALPGIETGMATEKRSDSVITRTDKSKTVTDSQNKALVLNEILNRKKGAEHFNFVGDDVADLEMFNRVGSSACPGEAISEIKKASDDICEN